MLPDYRTAGLSPVLRTEPSTIFVFRKVRSDAEEQPTGAQLIAAVKQMEAGRKGEDVAREVGVSTHTIYAGKSKYGGMDVSEAQEAKRLRDQNPRLR